MCTSDYRDVQIQNVASLCCQGVPSHWRRLVFSYWSHRSRDRIYITLYDENISNNIARIVYYTLQTYESLLYFFTCVYFTKIHRYGGDVYSA